MKNKLLISVIVLIILVAATILIIKANSNEIQIENPIVKYNDKEISTIKTYFYYTSRLRSKYNYYVDDNDVIESLDALSALPNTELKIGFPHEPNSYMVVKMLDNGNYEKLFEIKDVNKEIHNIITPSTTGKYIYSISASYEEGTGIYYFAVDVQTNN